MSSGPTTSSQIDGETMETVRDFIFLDSKITADCDCSYEIKRLAPWNKSCDKLRQHIKKQRHYFASKSPSSQSYVFSSSHLWLWELDHKESWAPKDCCFWTAILENTLKSPLECKEIKPVNPKGNQSWIYIGRTDAEFEVPVFCPLDWKRWLTRKVPDAGKIKGRAEGDYRGRDGWMASLTQWTWVWASLGDVERQRSLTCCSPKGCK